MDRRTFLKLTGGSALFIGLQPLLGQDEKQDWMRLALERMKKENKPGVAILVPAEYGAQRELGRKLLALLQTESDDVMEILCEAVFVCVRGEFPGRDGDTAALFDLEGRRIEGLRLDLERFAEQMGGLLHGQRLEERARVLRKDFPMETFEKLGGDLEEADQAAAVLDRHADRFLPLYVWMRIEMKPGIARDRLRAAIRRYFGKGQPDENGPRLPFGTKVVEHRGCGEDPQSKCGRASVSGPAKKFLQFAAK
jgi:hypothetical protein